MRTRAGTKAPVSAIVINDETRKEGGRRNGRESARKLSFPRRSITRRHYFLSGRRYKWCSTIRESGPIDILSTDSRMRHARERQKVQLPWRRGKREERGSLLEFSHAEEKFPRARERPGRTSLSRRRRIYPCEKREEEGSLPRPPPSPS